MAETLAGNYPQHFFVEGKYLGTAQRGLALHAGQYAPPVSFAFFCPHCADLWARCPVGDYNGTDRDWMVWTMACRKHPSRTFSVAGSLYLAWEKSFSDSFPPELLAWELDRHLDYAERILLKDL
jgi:hypothetical protein